MTVKGLSRYRELMVRLDNAQELLQSLQNASRPAAAVIDGMPRGQSTKDQVGKLVAAIADLTERIEYLKRQLAQERKKVYKFIDGVPDERVRTALRLKYITGFTWEQVAGIFGEKYTMEYIKKICYRCIDNQ